MSFLLPLFLQATAPIAVDPTPPPPPPAYEPPPPSYVVQPRAAPEPYDPRCNRDDEDGEWELDDKGCRTKHRKRWEPGSMFGVRLGVTNVSSSDKDGTFVGAMASLQAEQFKAGPGRIFSGHSSIDMSLGGGSAGLEGSLGGLLTAGFRAPFGRTHGPFARIGLWGELMGNKRFYWSHLDLPVGEVGYQYSSLNTVAEIGGRGAAVITGRYDTGIHTRRELGDGSFEWAIYGALHSAIGRIDISYTTIEARDLFPGAGVTNLRAKGCIYLPHRLGACLDGMVIDGRAYTPIPGLRPVTADVSSVYGGVTIGVVDL